MYQTLLHNFYSKIILHIIVVYKHDTYRIFQANYIIIFTKEVLRGTWQLLPPISQNRCFSEGCWSKENSTPSLNFLSFQKKVYVFPFIRRRKFTSELYSTETTRQQFYIKKIKITLYVVVSLNEFQLITMVREDGLGEWEVIEPFTKDAAYLIKWLMCRSSVSLCFNVCNILS